MPKRSSAILLLVFLLSGSACAEGKNAGMILLRHGESSWNAEGRLAGWSNIPLTKKGEEQALKAGQFLKTQGLTVDSVYTSCLDRAIKTAWLAMEGMGEMYIPFTTDWRLNERCSGALESMTIKEIVARYGAEQVKDWTYSFDSAPPARARDAANSPALDPRYSGISVPQTESLKDSVERVRRCLDETLLPAVKSGKRILVVAHGGSLTALALCLDPDNAHKMAKMKIPNAVPILVEFDDKMKLSGFRLLESPQ